MCCAMVDIHDSVCACSESAGLWTDRQADFPALYVYGASYPPDRQNCATSFAHRVIALLSLGLSDQLSAPRLSMDYGGMVDRVVLKRIFQKLYQVHLCVFMRIYAYLCVFMYISLTWTLAGMDPH
jgi:hypothetical protein